MASVLMRGKFVLRQTDRGKKAMYGWKKRLELYCPSQGPPRIASNHQKLGGAKKDSSWDFGRSVGLLTP